jgi:hypothetical protein
LELLSFDKILKLRAKTSPLEQESSSPQPSALTTEEELKLPELSIGQLESSRIFILLLFFAVVDESPEPAVKLRSNIIESLSTPTRHRFSREQ